jgi:hypothetical protein
MMARGREACCPCLEACSAALGVMQGRLGVVSDTLQAIGGADLSA